MTFGKNGVKVIFTDGTTTTWPSATDFGFNCGTYIVTQKNETEKNVDHLVAYIPYHSVKWIGWAEPPSE